MNKKNVERCVVVKKRINNEERINEEIIFKWDRENDRESVGKCIWKNK